MLLLAIAIIIISITILLIFGIVVVCYSIMCEIASLEHTEFFGMK